MNDTVREVMNPADAMLTYRRERGQMSRDGTARTCAVSILDRNAPRSANAGTIPIPTTSTLTSKLKKALNQAFPTSIAK
jgi:hypothetical protein